MVAGDGNDQDRRALHAGQRPRHSVPPDGGADRPRAGPTVVVENRPGGGTVIGTEAVERAEPDGRTVLLVANSFVINPPLQRASYDPTTSFEPVCYLASTPMVLVVLGSSPYRTLTI